MGWVGLCYALSQGFFAKYLIKLAGEDPTMVLLFCIAGLTLGRVYAMLTENIYGLYITMAVVIIALGIFKAF